MAMLHRQSQAVRRQREKREVMVKERMRPGEEVKEGGWWEKKWRSGRRSEGVEEEVEEWKRKKRSGRKSEGVEEEVEELSLEIVE